jgi:putative tricarboxylic transport membrane protein
MHTQTAIACNSGLHIYRGYEMIFTHERIAAIVLIIFGGSAYWVAQTTLPSRAGAMPSTVAILIVILAAVLLLRPTKRDEEGEVPKNFAASWPRLLRTIVLSLFYFAIATPLGFVTATVVFIVSVGLLAGFRNTRFLLSSALIFSVMAQIIFVQLLGLQLPEDLIVNLLQSVAI